MRIEIHGMERALCGIGKVRKNVSREAETELRTRGHFGPNVRVNRTQSDEI
jgi:hypothetical protein